MYVLERLDDAKRRGAKIYGELVGYAMNSDASDFVLPNPERQAAVHAAGAAAGPDSTPSEIDIVSTHATGTGQRRRPGVRRAAASVRRQLEARASTTPRASSATRWAPPGRWSWPATCRPSTTASATRRSTSTSSIPSAPCRAWCSTSRARSAEVDYILNNSFGMLGINSVVIIKQVVARRTVTSRTQLRHAVRSGDHGMTPAEIREEVLDILSNIAPDEDLSQPRRRRSRSASSSSSTAWTSSTSSWSCASGTASRFRKTTTCNLASMDQHGRRIWSR